MTLQGMTFSPFARKACEWTLCTGLLATLFTLLLVNVDVASKLFNVTALVSLLYIIAMRKYLPSQKTLLVLTGVIFLIGIYNVLWLEIFKPEKTDFSGTYRAYLYAARMLISGAFIILAFSLIAQNMRRAILSGLAVLLIAAAIYAGIQEFQQHLPRPLLAFKVATTAGYAIALIGIVCSAWLIQLKPKLYPLTLALISACVLTALALNETRAAMLTYPVIILLMLLVNYSHSRKKLLKRAALFFVLLVVCSVVMKDIIQQRTQNLMSDITSYQNNNSNTSVGARLAMYQVGLQTMKFNLIGQSIEDRRTAITTMLQQHPNLSGAAPYVNVHLHNEIIETLSLKGAVGTLLLIFLYITLIYYSIYHKNISLFAVTLAIMLFGLSDVLLYSREMPIVATSCLALCILLQQNKVNDERKACS
ncbi:hypothetical protein CHU32_12980 [Superficieibacter electus]|uniref:O-antigen ligase-related domain-containing protein n=1 Tax=Superficieibacter electus TaxID=2022662 RepID=A0A2P5GPX5_9ENTR|nr:O-antigen ligase family protein [Superficieibacter electus]POP45325.1 hypothetical protein CHU33_10055 [Superficieibacter electus]POP48608.1 hypothetical protein CHU32_12980 [Superficieibacter electus]